jgi:hypothetical protein
VQVYISLKCGKLKVLLIKFYENFLKITIIISIIYVHIVEDGTGDKTKQINKIESHTHKTKLNF